MGTYLDYYVSWDRRNVHSVWNRPNYVLLIQVVFGRYRKPSKLAFLFLVGELLFAPPSLDDFRAFVQSKAADIYGGIVSPVVGSAFSGWSDEPTLLDEMDKGLSKAKAYAAKNLTGIAGPKGQVYTLGVNHRTTHSKVIANAKGGSLSCEIADVVIVCKYNFANKVLFERSVFIQAKAENKTSAGRWKVDWDQLELYYSWPTINNFTHGSGVIIPGFPQSLTLKPTNRLFSTFMLARRHVFPFPYFLDFDHDIIGADLLHSATINVGRKTFKGAGEIPFGHAMWDLILQSVGEELIINGSVHNNGVKAMVDAILKHIGVPDAVEREKPMIGVEFAVSAGQLE